MMKRPMLHIAFAYSAGIVLAWYIRQVFIIIAIFPILMLVYWYGVKKSVPYMKYLLLWAIFIICGYANYALRYTILTQPFEPYYGNHVAIEGYVNSACETDQERVTFEFFVENILYITDSDDVDNAKNITKSYIGRNVFVNIYGVNSSDNYSLGDGLIIDGELRHPNGSRNPGGFNYENYMFSKNIPATLSLNENQISKIGTEKKLYLKRFGVNARQYILASLDNYLSEEKSSLIVAMITGYRGNLTEPMENAFSASGLTHIMAVSGANIVFILSPLIWLFGIIGLNRKTSSIIAIPFIFLYVLVTGMESSVLRASVMAVLILIGRTLDRKADIINSLGIAVVVILFVNPFMFFDVGFLLSVGATAGIGILYKRVRKAIPNKLPKFVGDTVAATISAQAGVLPLLIISFNKVSLVSLLSNLLVVPVTGFATCLGVACIFAGSIHPLMGTAVGYALEAVLHVIMVVANTCASVQWAEVYVGDLSYFFIVFYYVVVFLWGIHGINIFIYNKAKVFACIFMLGIFIFIQGILPNTLKITYLDVGQGDCILVQTPEGQNYLIDGGGKYNELETGYCGKQVIIPLLMHERIYSIDTAMVTHAHTDHIGGILTLVENFPIKEVGLPKYSGAKEDFNDLIMLCEEKKIPVVFYNKGDVIKLDNETSFEILWPVYEEMNFKDNLNDSSICGVLKFKEFSALFTGDISNEIEKSILEQRKNLDCDILKVAHHGGKGSTSWHFLEYVRPEVSIISVGKNNYGHPSDEVINRLMSVKSTIYTTKECGAVIVQSNGSEFKIRTWARKRRYTFL
ncbi:MAG: DNA internalization-related competence protein ComEC/Rec2 [Clostridiaceae bacterium]|nr:DNA internalization-related competence protein ComEC/Rec2 [Clostridiaceae bacterium]